LNDEQWKKLEMLFETKRGRGRRGRDDRNFIEAVLWMHRTGAPWRDLPNEFGPWTTVYNRFDRWSRNGRWKEVFEALKSGGGEFHGVDDEWHCIDSTINRAHQHSAGAKGGLLRTG
jgi:transposase